MEDLHPKWRIPPSQSIYRHPSVSGDDGLRLGGLLVVLAAATVAVQSHSGVAVYSAIGADKWRVEQELGLFHAS